jgi:CHAT domain-containing protein
LQADKPHSELINNYAQAINNWEAHLNKIKKNYPAYYNMRYATLFKPIEELQSSLADSITVIRYFDMDSLFIALVIDKKNKKLTHINKKGLEEEITVLLSDTASEKSYLSGSYDLYKKLWQPIEPFTHTKRLIIIPDGILYNLSIDMLTKKPVTTYNDLLSSSLLSEYSISYHYSLFMLGQPKLNIASNGNYIAFAPVFSDEIKTRYRSVIKDSMKLDYSYLNLLPQPNVNKLAKKIKGLIGGEIYLEENSTRSSFKKNADGHKIIHIGTHAEYNNVHPEQSGLIFAKNISATSDTNFLSLNNIYNCNMHADLAVLTACESGKPGYQDGEGMISLAHAFNYAGSERILTALWKIDEQSSSRITELFVENLRSGEATDEALRKAKLEYLEHAEGRMKSPLYWSGLVIMGEPAQIEFINSTNWFYWIAGALTFALIILSFLKLRKRQAA